MTMNLSLAQHHIRLPEWQILSLLYPTAIEQSHTRRQSGVPGQIPR